jgi:hypothetical protein
VGRPSTKKPRRALGRLLAGVSRNDLVTRGR